MRLPRRALAALLAAPAMLPGIAPGGAMAQGQPLQFGVMPNVSARVLLAQYQPFRSFLEAELARPVEVVTAPGLAPFQERSLAGAYGLVVTAANLGRVAQLDAGLRPVMIYEPRIPGLLVTHRDRPLRDIARLRGCQVAMTNPQSLVALKFIHWLRAAGLAVGHDVTAVHARNEDSLAQLLTGPDTPLAVMSRGEFNAIRADIRDTLVVWQQFATVPGFLVLLGPSLRGPEADRLLAVLARFPASPAGRQFFEATGFRGIRPVTEADLAELDDVVEETRSLLRAG
jgi:phosphonate transport system substrate-binding protein